MGIAGTFLQIKQESYAVLSQGEPRDAAVNVDTFEVYSGIARFSLR